MPYNFINPYNFIPLGGKVVPENREETYTGYISYSLFTKTPLFIPNTSNDKAFSISDRLFYDENNKVKMRDDKPVYHKSLDFFSYNNLKNEKNTESGDCEPVETVNTDQSAGDNGEKNASGSKKYYDDDFFEPVIPGSEIRGLIRSSYEALTNSCLSAIEDDKDVMLNRRSNEVFKPGLIEKDSNGGFNLWDAKDYLLRTAGENSLTIDSDAWDPDLNGNYRKDDKYALKCYIQKGLKEGEQVRVLTRNNRPGKEIVTDLFRSGAKGIPREAITGYIIKGEDGPVMKDTKANSVSFDKTMKNQKHCIHVFKSIGTVPKKTSLDVSVLDKVLKAYVDNGEHLYEEYSDEWKIFKGKKVIAGVRACFPVYYSTVNGTYYMLSPSSITREIFENKLSNLLKGHIPCKDKKSLCPACSLFGMLKAGRDAFSVASRVRMSDLTLSSNIVDGTPETKKDNRSYYEDLITLKELSSPKLQNTEFYLKKPDENAISWTYDYYVDNNGNVVSICPEINGRKFYWHHPDFNLESARAADNETTERNMTIRPLKAGIHFSGKVFFEGISQNELERLITILNGCENETSEIKEKKYGYKLGSAKPLGLGSIALNVDEVKIRKIVKEDNASSGRVYLKEVPYSECKPKSENCGQLFDKELLEAFKKTIEFEALKELTADGAIDYPRMAPDGDIFEWFVNNHKSYDWRRNKTVNMANSRNQLFFGQYMEALEAKLKRGYDFFNANGGTQNSGNGSNGNRTNVGGMNKNASNNSGVLSVKIKNYAQSNNKPQMNVGFIQGGGIVYDVPKTVTKPSIKVRFLSEKNGKKSYVYVSED